MMVVTILGPAKLWGDNKVVVHSASIPEKRITKKHLGICYHAVHDASAQDIWKVVFCKGVNNITDRLTNVISVNAKGKTDFKMYIHEVDYFFT